MHLHMTSDTPQESDFVLLGSYSPRDAAKLLQRLEKAGIAFRTRDRKPLPEPGPTAVIDITVDSSRAEEVSQIQRDLFGDALPNYKSSFFRERRNV
jgi:hypothetical protein